MTVTRAMRGQPKRLSLNYLRRNGGYVILHVLVPFHAKSSQPPCCSAALSFVLCSFSCSLFSRLNWVLGSLIKQKSTETGTSTMVV